VIGTRVNNYEIVSLIGEGGMGNVYLARHPLIDRRAAIKVLHPELASDRGQVTRFFNEARAANAIRHPNIIDIIDVGLLPGSERPYLMMELLEGETLASRLVRLGSLTAEAAIEIARQTASALGAAHTKGIIHRDLKPDNLFLVPQRSPPGRDLVKLLDFGIAKLRSELGGTNVRTRTGLLLGTPPYMSPEQCQGLSAGIDRRTDVYALGIILFEMVCGAPPFLAEGFGNVLIMHLTQEPPSPRSRNPAVPPALEAIILRALAKEPDGRFDSMAALEAALAAVPPAAAGQAVAPASRNRHRTPAPTRVPSATRALSSELEAVGEVATDPAARRARRSYRPLVVGSVVMVALAGAAYLGLTQRLSVGASPPAAAFNAQATAAPIPELAPETITPPRHTSPEAPPPPAAGVPDAGAAAARTRRPARRTMAPAVARPPRRGPEKW
jgi:eukaryotic-like serine/threonine-protein kinase